jgi:hypothetical protein
MTWGEHAKAERFTKLVQIGVHMQSSQEKQQQICPGGTESVGQKRHLLSQLPKQPHTHRMESRAHKDCMVVVSHTLEGAQRAETLAPWHRNAPPCMHRQGRAAQH